eukprot:11207958-Ditylum_brightwellii.AAC.1
MGLAANSEVPGLGVSRNDVAQAFLNANMASTSSRSSQDQVGGSPPPLPGATAIVTELQTTLQHSHERENGTILISPPPVQEDQDRRALLLRDFKGNDKLPMPIDASEVYERNVILRKKMYLMSGELSGTGSSPCMNSLTSRIKT